MTVGEPLPHRPLDGAVALVTGAARGLGRAYALRLARLGAAVGVTDVRFDSFEDYAEETELAGGVTVMEEIRAAGGRAHGVEADAASATSMRRAVREIADALGGAPTICICNAGGGLVTRTDAEAARAIKASAASRTRASDLKALLDRNLGTTIATVGAVVPGMQKAGGGAIVTVSSMAGLQPTNDGSYAAYGAAKAGVVTYTRYLAQELGPHGIRVNCIAPGYIATGRVRRQFEALGVEKVSSRIALRRLGTTEDCAGAVEFLVTPLSAYVTGVVLPVDGLARPLGD
jgi:3-oxoacyl-[acyl-carrier protein] reductase